MERIESIIEHAAKNPFRPLDIQKLYKEKDYPFLKAKHSIELSIDSCEFLVGYWHEIHHGNIIIKRLNVGLNRYANDYPRADIVDRLLHLFCFGTDLNNFVLAVDEPAYAGTLGYTTTEVMFPFAYIPTINDLYGRRMNMTEIVFPLIGQDVDSLSKWLESVKTELSKFRVSPKPNGMPEHNFQAIGYGLERLKSEIEMAIFRSRKKT
jgi:hypothetical protein